MSGSDRTPAMSGNKRAASPTAATAEAPTQRMRLAEAVSADPPVAVRPPLSAAQRCATDTLTLVFGFIEFIDLVHAASTCKAWLTAAAKDQPRDLLFDRAERLAALCDSSSPLKRHISRVDCTNEVLLGLTQLAQLARLPQLTALEAELNAADLTRLMDEEGGGAPAALTAAFPRKLRELSLSVSPARCPDVWQLLLDALPVMKELARLSLDAGDEDQEAGHSAWLSLEPLLQLPQLTCLTLSVGELTVAQLRVIKQISTLQYFDAGWKSWTTDQLSAFCLPPHRLQRLQKMEMWNTDVNGKAMAELMCLPALTAIEPRFLAPDSYAHLPRFPRLRRLCVGIDLHSGDNADQRQARTAVLLSALSACSALTDLALIIGDCPEPLGDQLMQAVPRLRSLAFRSCSLPSLRFLRHAQNLKELSLFKCETVRPGHVTGIGAFAPQLERLNVEECPGLQLDEAEERLLSPPGAMGLPRLREFDYRPSSI